MDLPIVLGGVIVLIALLVFAAFIPMLFRRIVPANEVHVLQSGKNTTSFGQPTGNGNVYYKWPTWIPVIGVEVKSLSVSIFDIELDAYDAFDKGRLPFLVDVMAFFRINDYAVAAQRVSSNQHLVDQLTSIVQGAVRSIIAKSDIEEVMEERSILGDKFTAEVKEQLKSWGIEAVKNIELMDIKDAPKSEIIHNIMAKKKSHIEMESRLEVAKNMKLAEVAENEALKEVNLKKQETSQIVGLRTVEAQEKVEIATEAKKQNVIQQTKITTERQMDVLKIEQVKAAEINKEVALISVNQQKEVALIEANKTKDVAVLKANQEKEVAVISTEKDFQARTRLAEADLTVRTKSAEGELILKTNEAKAIELAGLAKAKSEEALLLAPVNAQTTLAKEIGQNKEYQEYLLSIRRIESDQAIGEAQANALSNADIKIIANSGSAMDGLKSLKDVVSSNGGTQVGAFMEGLANTDIGKKVLDKVLS